MDHHHHQLTGLDEHQDDEPHVLIFPLPIQGHVNSMLKLAELLCLSGLHVSFLVSTNIHSRLSRYADTQSRFSVYPRFKLETLPGELYQGHPDSNDRLTMLFDSLQALAKPFLREFLRRGGTRSRPPVSCIISDGVFGFALDVAEELSLPVIYFRTVSACAFWAYFCIPQLIKAEELPFHGRDLDVPVENVKGMESFLRRRDLPSFCRADISDSTFKIVLHETQQTTRAQALILNTFEDLEGPILSQIRKSCPNVYTIGPLHAHLKFRLAGKSTPSSPMSSNSLWEVDKGCITWLDKQPPKSVLYISFGSITTVTREQLLEFWHGIVNSGKRFLWVIRPESIVGKGSQCNFLAPAEELEEATKQRGCMVGWAPQEEVLAHAAIGGFLTHSGWNSTLESIVEGVPMMCWPFFADQQVNSRFVEMVWKMGLDMKDTCERGIVEKVVREVMEVRRDEFMEKGELMKKLAKESIKEEGGSSRRNLDRLVRYIRSTALPPLL